MRIVWMIALWMLAGCAPLAAPEPTPVEPTLAPTESPTHIPVDIPPAQLKAVEALAQALGVDPGEVKILSSEAVDWPDGCLGAARPGMMCTQMIVPGFRILLEAGGVQYEYRTNQDGSQVVSAAKIFSWTRSGGIAGFCDELAIYLPDEIVASGCKVGTKVDQFSAIAFEKERAQMLEWVKTYAGQTLTRSDNAAADGMTVEIAFAGQGSEKAVPAEVEAEMFEMLGDLFARTRP
jgi:hypothetical protein